MAEKSFTLSCNLIDKRDKKTGEISLFGSEITIIIDEHTLSIIEEKKAKISQVVAADNFETFNVSDPFLSFKTKIISSNKFYYFDIFKDKVIFTIDGCDDGEFLINRGSLKIALANKNGVKSVGPAPPRRNIRRTSFKDDS